MPFRAIPHSKFGCPVVPTRAIERPRLTEELARADWRVALVTGGAATGKTVLVAQWFKALGTVAREWVTLDTNDDRPGRFWLTFALALDRAAPGGFTDSVAAATDGHRVRPDFFDRLLIEWSALEGPIVIVLDDVHCLHNRAIIEDLSFVIDHLPEGSRMLLTSRADPSMPIGRWRGRSWLVELRHRDLACTLPETASLLVALDEHRLSTSEVELLWHHTEGWVAALRLAVAGLKNRADLAGAIEEFSGRDAVVADLLAEEVLHRAPDELADFLLRTSVTDVLDSELCDALSGRSDSGEVLRGMEAELKFVIATRPDRSTYRYHPLLAQMLRAELGRRYPQEVPALNRTAAVVLEGRGDIVGAVRCLLAAGDVDQAFSLLFLAAFRRHDHGDIGSVSALVSLFPQELVNDSASHMLTYALALGLCGRANEGLPWLQRAALRIAEASEPEPKDLATLDAIRLLGFTTTGEIAEEIDAGRRALDAVEQGCDLGIVGARTRMNLVRGYLLVDDPGEADRVLHAGSPGDEIATLVLAPALAARIAVRQGNLIEAISEAQSALNAARAFGLDTHFGALDAHLALVGTHIDRNDLTEATETIGRLEEILQGREQALPYRVMLDLEKVRRTAVCGDLDDVFAIVGNLHKLTDHAPRSPLRQMVDAAAARWHLELGETPEAADLIARLPLNGSSHTLLRTRLDLACGRTDAATRRITQATLPTRRDRIVAELLLARGALVSNEDASMHVRRAVELAAPEHLVRAVLEEGDVVARLARAAAESLRTEAGASLALALGAPSRAHGGLRQSTVVLSERELSVLRFLPSRLTNSEMARECFMSVNTVKSHLKGIYAKLGVSSRADAVSRASLLGLLGPDRLRRASTARDHEFTHSG